MLIHMNRIGRLIPVVLSCVALGQIPMSSVVDKNATQIREVAIIAASSGSDQLRKYFEPKNGEVFVVKYHRVSQHLYLIFYNKNYTKALAVVFDTSCLDWPSSSCIANYGYGIMSNHIWSLYPNSVQPFFESNGGIATRKEIKDVISRAQHGKTLMRVRYDSIHSIFAET